MGLNSFDTTWTNLLDKIMSGGAETAPRGLKTKELIGNISKFDMSEPVLTVTNRKLGYKFLAAEAWWILSGDNKVSTIKPYSKMISKFSDDGVTFEGAYGPPVADQLGYVINTLFNDTESRQAVLTIWRPRPGPTKDVPCTVSAQWFIRNGELDCVMYMRSSDAWLGVPYDVFNFSMISGYILARLLKRGYSNPLELGSLYLAAGSQHIYENHWEDAKDCIFDATPLFEYEPFNPAWFADDPEDLIRHLKALADQDWDSTRGYFLQEMISIKDKNSDDKERSPRGY